MTNFGVCLKRALKEGKKMKWYHSGPRFQAHDDITQDSLANIIHFETPSFLISGKAIWRITWADGEAHIGYLCTWNGFPSFFSEGIFGRKDVGMNWELSLCLCTEKHLKKFPNLFGACRVLQICPARKGEGYAILCILLMSERDLMLTSDQPFLTGEILI